MDIISIIISIGASVISGMALFFLQRYFKKKEKREAERDRVRRRENVLLMKSLDAVGKLTYANAIAIRDGKTNGEMHEAMEVYNESKEEMYDYILEQNSKIIGGN